MAAHNVLVVWNEIPESSCFVIFPSISTVAMEKMRKWHGHFVNDVNTPVEIQDDINEAFYDKDGKFKRERIDKPISNWTFDLIISTGFIM